MSKKLYFLISFVLVLSLAYTSYGYDPCTGVVGNWEDPCDANHDGWDIWPDSAGFVTAEYNDVTGVTLGSRSIKLTVTEGGWQLVWRLRFQNDPNLLQAFFDNDSFSVDVTRLAAEWQPPGQFSGVYLVVNAGSGLGGISKDLGARLWWGPNDGNTTLPASWEYGYLHDGVNDGNDSNNPEIDPNDVNYVEFIIVTNFDDANYPQGTYYLDNAKLRNLGGQQEPVAWWKFDEASGTIAEDSSDGNHDGTMNGGITRVATGSPYNNSGYLDFDGMDDWIDINSIPQGAFLLGRYTISMWFRVDGGAGQRDLLGATNSVGDHGILLELGRGTAPRGIHYIHRAPYSPDGHGDDAEAIFTSSDLILNDGRWHHVAAVRASDTSRLLYIDGTQVGTNTNVEPAFVDPARVALGVLKFSFLGRWWNGGIDDVRIYNRALSAAEILDLVVTPKAWQPTPGDGEGDVSQTPTLSWRAGKYAADVNGHKVYFDDVGNNVTNRNGCDVNGVVTTDPCYPISTTLPMGKTYYWAVDEVNDPCMWPGDVWSFTTLDYTSVDNFESYANDAALAAVWKKVARALVYLGTDPNYVHSGNKSMEVAYRNASSAYYSEAYADTATLPSEIGSNWSAAKLLTLYFKGLSLNDPNEPMYVILTDGSAHTAKVLYDGNRNYLKDETWHEWNIPLPLFTDVNMANVTRITIGFGDKVSSTPTWTSYMYFDDIRVYLPKCVFSERSADFAKADYYPFSYPDFGDCMINGQELEVMANDWLAEDNVITPTTDPNIIGGLVAYYPMNEGSGTIIDDANGNPSYQGTFSAAGVSWATPGVIIDGSGTSAVYVNGLQASRISSGTWDPVGPTGGFTLSIWAKWNGPGVTTSQGLIGKRDGWDSSTVRFMFEVFGNNQLRLGSYANSAYSQANIMQTQIGRWAHIAATFNGNDANNVTFYLNGQDVGTGTCTLGTNTATTMVIGNTQNADWSNESFNGELDEVRIYSRALSAAEIAYLADTTPGDNSLHVPVPSFAELYEGEPEGSRSVNFKDFAYLANMWLEEQLWPH